MQTGDAFTAEQNAEGCGGCIQKNIYYQWRGRGVKCLNFLIKFVS